MPRKPSPKQIVNRAPVSPAATTQRWFEVTNVAEQNSAEIRLRGYIGCPTMERDWYSGEMVRGQGAGTLQEFESALDAIGNVANLTVLIFSEGGDVFTGMAIHNLLRRHPANKVCIIDGICASAATYPALACDEVRIPSNAWFMIHGTEGCCCGDAEDMRSYATMLDEMNSTLVNLYVARTGRSEAEITTMLQEETWMNGADAVANGFADTVIEPLANLAARAGTLQPTNSARLRHAPAEVLALFDMSRLPTTPANTAITTMSQPATPPAIAPASAPVAPAPTASAAPVNAAAPAPESTTTAPAAASATTPDLATLVTNAVNAAIAPISERLATIEAQRAVGISPHNLAGAPPAPVAGNGTESGAATNTMKRSDWTNLSPTARQKFITTPGNKLID